LPPFVPNSPVLQPRNDLQRTVSNKVPHKATEVNISIRHLVRAAKRVHFGLDVSCISTFFFTKFQTGNTAYYLVGKGDSFLGQIGRGLTLSTHLHLEPRWRMSEAIPPRHLYPFTPWLLTLSNAVTFYTITTLTFSGPCIVHRDIFL